MQKVILQEFPSALIAASIVWTKMLASDNKSAAIQAAQVIADPRVMHFYDPEGQVGKIVAESLGEPGQTAWDVYLFYKASDQWDKELPQPAAWVHQLMGTWTDHYRSGQDLETELHNSASRLLQALGTR